MPIGGCFCGQVRYDAGGTPFNMTLCHCADCRRATGAPMVAWFTVRPAALRFTAGAPKRFASSTGVTRSFCAACGTTLTFQHDGIDEVDVTTCSLDDPLGLPPADHCQDAGRLDWVQLADGLPRYAGWAPADATHRVPRPLRPSSTD